MYTSDDHTFAICAYKSSPHLEDCVKSVANQISPSNVFIATSTPNDHIANIARHYNLNVFVNPEQPGISSDWNFAVAQAHTPLITIAHQDDIYFSDYTSEMLNTVNTSDSPLLFFSDYGELRNGIPISDSQLLQIKRILLAPLKNRRLRGSSLVKRRCLSLGSPICCPSVTYHIPTLPKPLFLNNFKCDLDWETWERASKIEGDFLYSPKTLMLHRIHDESETSNLIADNTRSQEDLEMLEKFWPKFMARSINHFYAKAQNSNAL